MFDEGSLKICAILTCNQPIYSVAVFSLYHKIKMLYGL